MVAHVATHKLGAAAYAIKAARAAASDGEDEAAGRLECRWRRDQLPEAICELVLDDQWLRNDICRGAPVDHLAGLAGRPLAWEDVGDLLARWEHTPGQDSK